MRRLDRLNRGAKMAVLRPDEQKPAIVNNRARCPGREIVPDDLPGALAPLHDEPLRLAADQHPAITPTDNSRRMGEPEIFSIGEKHLRISVGVR